MKILVVAKSQAADPRAARTVAEAIDGDFVAVDGGRRFFLLVKDPKQVSRIQNTAGWSILHGSNLFAFHGFSQLLFLQYLERAFGDKFQVAEQEVPLSYQGDGNCDGVLA